MSWDDINTVYTSIDFVITKNTVVTVEVTTDGSVAVYDSGGISTKTILNNWTYPTGSKDIKPFKLLDYSLQETGFKATLQFVKKSKEIDEIKLLCQDIIDVYNYEKLHVIKWETKLASN
ncbi:hypothetical protein PaeBR_08610 [Paenibacillus sp. BR2-3]|uniref:hypothetical protein n=1 Tax=Paenibacillus sp. BR2-3 TaxID=3048494 RepID=UPI0039777AF7